MCNLWKPAACLFPTQKLFFCVKWYANPTGTEVSVHSCAPSRRHHCAHAVCRGSTCCSVSQRPDEGGLKFPLWLCSQGAHENICVIFLFPVPRVAQCSFRHISSFVFLKQSDNVRGGIFCKGRSFCLSLGKSLIFSSCGSPLRLLIGAGSLAEIPLSGCFMTGVP